VSILEWQNWLGYLGSIPHWYKTHTDSSDLVLVGSLELQAETFMGDLMLQNKPVEMRVTGEGEHTDSQR
jgi:hypothetical protein